MKLSIIIVNYNVQYFLENCLNSVFQAINNIKTEVIVVDNNSVDGSLKMLEEKFPSVKIIANKDNKGFSKANNQALVVAKGEYVLLLNPDTVVEENTFNTCLTFFDKNNEAGGLGVKMLDGAGQFLPESKRGLPTPSVAFYKIFGLSSLFPKSKKFGKYHLGSLSKDKNHQVEILSGAFMMIRSSVLQTIGFLDESFFMYGEDIDLSYRITQAGYKNYYLADTSIIHYKGESTKKSSINYVFVFYRAMAIFAKKHFSNKNAQLFSLLINLAIYFRAAIAMLSRTIKFFVLPILDALVLYVGIYFIKILYETKVKFIDGGGYPDEVEMFGIPIIASGYLISLWFSGGYKIPTPFKKIVQGLSIGTLLVFVGYSLLDEEFRFSRAIVLLSTLYAFTSITLLRWVLHLLQLRKLKVNKTSRIAIVGLTEEIDRVSDFLKNSFFKLDLILKINPKNESEGDDFYNGQLYQLQDIIEIYKLNEVIFCSKDIKSEKIIECISLIANQKVDFKIAPPKSLFIIGSSNNSTSGDFYLSSTNTLMKEVNQKNKRLLDLTLSIVLLVLSPLLVWFQKSKILFFKSLSMILVNKVSFVGFTSYNGSSDDLLKIKPGIFTPKDILKDGDLNHINIESINLEYGRNYNVWKDLKIIFKNILRLGH